MSIYFDTTKERWIVRVSHQGQRYSGGQHLTRDSAERALLDLRQRLGQSPLNPKQLARDQQLRAKALGVARIQFAGDSPAALIEAAEALYQWLKHGNEEPVAEATATRQ